MIDHLSLGGVTDLQRSRAFYATYYAAFVTDPDGHRLEAVTHRPE